MSGQSSSSEAQGIFPNTRWSVILAAKRKASLESAAALESLCKTYWYPLYAFVRSSGRSPEDAQDLTQEFFSRLLAKDWLHSADPAKGRFRTFLRVALKRFLADDWDRARALKRGGGQIRVPFDTALAEQQFLQDRADAESPDRIFERRWAIAALAEATARLKSEYAENGKADELLHLIPHLTAERGTIPYADIAAALGMNAGAVRVAVHRLRKRFREIFRDTIADTVSTEAEIQQETRHIRELLGGD